MSKLVLCGLNYHFAPIAVRERFTIPESCLQHALQGLKRLPHIEEAVVLSTCNRTEVYAVVSEVKTGLQQLESFFTSVQGVADHNALKPNFKLLHEDVALHLLRVASGLDSMVLGEGQIMYQVKAAHQAALAANTIGATLDALFKFALGCGKRVRSETSMGQRAVSISSAAVELARELLGNSNNKKTLVLGAGKMGQICLKLLLNDQSINEVTVANRSAEKVQGFLNNNIRNLDRLKVVSDFNERYDFAAQADLIIVASSAPNFVLVADQLEKARARFQSKPLYIIDIAVPRNVDPEIGKMSDVSLYNSDDLSAIVNHNLAEREALVSEAEAIVFAILKDFKNWQRNLLVVPTINDLREKIEAIRLQQIEKSNALTPELEEISRAMINQILHQPMTQLKAASNHAILKQQAEALRVLFDLDPLTDNQITNQPDSAMVKR